MEENLQMSKGGLLEMVGAVMAKLQEPKRADVRGKQKIV